MQNHLSLPIHKIINDTPQAIQIVFQDVHNEIKNFLPGQFLTMVLTIDGKQVRRSYSICTSPSELPFIGVCVKRVNGGLVSNYLPNHVKVGDYIQVLPPYGNFTLEANSHEAPNLVLFGGGSGITPLMSIIKTTLEQTEATNTIHLYYANSNQNQIIFNQQLHALAESNPKRLKITHLISKPDVGWEGPALRCNAALVQDLVRFDKHHLDLQAKYYVCGPNGMMDAVILGLESMGISKSLIHKESFAPTTKSTVAEPKSVFENSSSAKTVTIIFGGNKHQFEVKEGEKILEKALEANIDLPYACQMGICGMCRAVVKQGKIEMEEQEAISESEINGGACLTCVGKPISEDLVIDYDC